MIDALALVTILGIVPVSPMSDGEDIIREMHDRYAGKWYETLALVQTVNYFDRETGGFDSARVWYESLVFPGTVRSDVAPLDAGNRWFYKDASWIEIRSDTVFNSSPGPHPLLLLGFDVYFLPVEETLARLQRFRIDFSQVREDEWQGRKVWVIGSTAPDDSASQIWIDQERLIFMRLLLTSPNTGAQTEYRFDRYEKLGDGWIGTEVVFIRNGVMTMLERYHWWDIGMEFAPSLFETTGATLPTWVKN
jgi:hypothetical protein